MAKFSMPWFHVLIAVAGCLVAQPAAALSVAGEGSTPLRLVLSQEAIASERTAAEELSSYLERVTSASFPIGIESAEDESPAIWIGPTAMSRRLGIDERRLGPEEWRIRTDGENLVLVGGRPRGTLYAVYRFLEDFVGVRWWTPFEETVPRRQNLAIGEIDVGGQPAFVYRDLHGVRGPAVFHARNRANGHYSFLSTAYGGTEGYGPPYHVHTFFQYLPPDEHFESHPEFYSEIEGVRSAERSQLCLTNDALLDVVEARLRTYIEASRAEAERKQTVPPRLFDFSHNDWGRPCTCKPCRELVEREGGQAGPLVHFINRLAQRIAEDYPDVYLDTLAYTHTFRPPRDLRLASNAVLRLTALQYRDFAKPVTHPANREYREAIDGWRKKTNHLRIWDYTVTFGRRANNLPFPNLPVVAADFRYYLDHGVEGLLVQHNHPVLSDMRDLKLWIVLKLAEDPTRDLDELVRDFTDGFYGPAAETIREYLTLLERAAKRKPASIRFHVNYEQYRYLEPNLVRRSQALFDLAERQVEDDAVLLRRLRFARLSLDRATLLRWDPRLARAGRSWRSRGPALDPLVVAQRYRDTALEQIQIRIHPSRRDDQAERVRREIEKLLRRLEHDETGG
jgi:hypothetical protein